MKKIINLFCIIMVVSIPVIIYAQNPVIQKSSTGLPGTESIVRIPYSSAEVTTNPDQQGIFLPIKASVINGPNTRGNTVLKTLNADEILAPGEKMYFSVNTQDQTLVYNPPVYTIDPLCYTAINRAPKWLRSQLLYQFRRLHKVSKDDNYAQIIIDAPEKCVDEVAWCVANLSYKVLNNTRCYATINTLLKNAQMIYDVADSLKYVKLVEYGSFASGDYYTTTKYRIRNGSSGSYSWVEVPRDIYYKYIVNPKIDQEGLYVQDNTSDNTERTYGYFWREYLWYNPIKTYDYTKLNITTAYGSIDTIQRFGSIMKQPDYLWDRVETYFLFNRPFKTTDYAMDILGHWASRAIPLTADNPRAFQPNQTAFEHNGNCLEDAILCAAACRTALIPIVYLNELGEDHAFGSFWDQGWHHFEFFRGGFDPNISASFRGMTNMTGDGSYGWTTSYVRGVESDGSVSNHTKEYTVDNGMATIEVKVADFNGKPIDGAKVVLWTKSSSSWVSNVASFPTSYSGIVTQKVGANVQYAYQIYHPVYGWYPHKDTAYIITSSKAVKDQLYSVTANYKSAAVTMPELKLANKLNVPATSNFGVHIQFTSKEIVTGTYTDIDQSEFGTFDSTGGAASVFICDETNFQKYSTGQSFDAYQVILRLSAGNMQIPLPAEGKWYLILSNELFKSNYQNITATCDLTSNASYSGINSDNNVPLVKIYPNPVSTELRIVKNEKLDNIRIIDIFGKVVYTLPEGINTWIPDPSISDGIYYFQYLFSGKTYSQKFVLNRHN